MSLLAHAVRGAVGMERERKELDKQIRFETEQARGIMNERGVSWGVAIALVRDGILVAANDGELK